MADNRPAAEIMSAGLRKGLTDRLKITDTGMVGTRVVTARDIEEVFEGGVEIDYAHTFEATTPAQGIVDLVCLHCDMAIPDVAVTLGAVTTTDKPGVSKVRLKATANVRTHVCGQQPLPMPRPPESEGQVGMDDEALDAEEAALRTSEDEDPDAEADAIERLEAAPSVIEDDDLLPGEGA